MQRIVVFVVLCLSLFSAFPAKSDENPPLKARGEIVVISGEPLASLFNTPMANLSLFAMTANGFEPVPFQIDQRFKKNNRIVYAYTGGKSCVNPDPNLDSLDELVFWSGDGGPKVNMDQWPASARGVEIAIDDDSGAPTGYVYLLGFPNEAPKSQRRYVTYDPKTDRVQSLYYSIGFPAKHKVGFDDLAITPLAGGSGEDFVDEAKYRVAVRLTGTIMPYELDRNQAHTKVVSWIDGPVRARREVRNYIELYLWLGSRSHTESVYTPSGFSIEAPVIGLTPNKFLTNLSTRWALELNKHGIGMTFKSDKNPQGMTIDGQMDEAERNIVYSPPAWLLVSGKPGAVLRRPGKLSKRPLYLDLYYMDNSGLAETPEDEPGQIGASGYYTPFAGRRGFKVDENIIEYYDVLPNYKPGDENVFLERASKPLNVIVSTVTVPIRRPGPTEWAPPQKAREDGPEPSYKYVGAEAPEIESQVLPVIVMSSDNGLGGGLMYVNANPFDTHIRFMTQAWYTVKSYTLTEFKIGEDVPRQGSDWAWIIYSKYHLRPGRDFYGIGNDSRREDRTNFYDEITLSRIWGKRRVYKPFWAGAYAELRHEFTTEGEGDWAPDTFSEKWFPNLLGKGAFWANRIGAFVLMDTRDSYYIPTKGGYRQLEYYSVPDWLGNDWEFEYWYLDLRQFIPIRQPRKDILALRLQAMRAGGGPIPFYELAIDGSEYTLRGYYDGRFRDRDMISMNTEWRHNLWKIMDMHFFYDVGRVFGDIFEEADLIPTDLHQAYGIGFRITIPPNVVMRGDVGWSNTDQVFYFNFGQTF